MIYTVSNSKKKRHIYIYIYIYIYSGNILSQELTRTIFRIPIRKDPMGSRWSLVELEE
jgi:hypothetical protein